MKVKALELKHALRGAVSAVGAFLAQTGRETRILALEAVGISLSLTGVAQYSVPVSLILGGVLIVIYAEVHANAPVPPR